MYKNAESGSGWRIRNVAILASFGTFAGPNESGLPIMFVDYCDHIFQ